LHHSRVLCTKVSAITYHTLIVFKISEHDVCRKGGPKLGGIDSFRRDLVGAGVISWKWERMTEVHRKRRWRVRIMEQSVVWPLVTKESKEYKKMS